MSLNFAWYNGVDSSDMIGQLQLALYPLGQSPKLNPDLNPTVSAQVPSTFATTLQNIANWWNLPRSQAARDTLIDAYIYQAMVLGTSPGLMVSCEEFIAENNKRMGDGAISYLFSAINSGTSTPIYSPSIALEAQKSIIPLPAGMDTEPNGQNIVLAEMATLWQLGNLQTGCNRGVLTDGQYWVFYEIQFQQEQFILNSTVSYDTDNSSGVASVLGLLSRFFVNFSSSTSQLLS